MGNRMSLIDGLPPDAIEAILKLAREYKCVIKPRKRQTRLVSDGVLIGGFNAKGIDETTGWHFYMTAEAAPYDEWATDASSYGFEFVQHPEGHHLWIGSPDNAQGFARFVGAVLSRGFYVRPPARLHS